MLSYIVVEQPIRRGALKHRGMWFAIPASAIVVSIAIIGATVGAESVVDSNTVAVQADTYTGSKAPRVIRILVVGDSVASSLAGGIAQVGEELTVAVANAARIGCNPLKWVGPVRDPSTRETFDVPCPDDWAARARTLAPKLVIIMFGRPPVNEVEVKGRWLRACDAPVDKAYRSALQARVSALRAAGPRVVIVTVPRPATRLWGPDADQRVSCVNRVGESVAAAVPGTTAVDINKLLCPDPGRRCLSSIGGTPVREDGLHFRGADAPLVARWLVPRALEALGTG
ncbi:MAG: hypothetical protein HYX34_01590 [Actinobacteria bacterium]|nr:hypothetical protein [Actinomycetota bacterium]